MRMKLAVLMLVQLPPPVHGAALRNKDLVESDVFRQYCDVNVVPIQTANKIDDIGAFRLNKILNVLEMFYKTFFEIIRKRIDITYITLSATGFALYKDVCLIMIAQILRQKVVCHMRNRGLDRSLSDSGYVSKLLLKSILKRCDFICMSNGLAADVNQVCLKPIIISNCLTRSPYSLSENHIFERLKSKRIIYISNIAESKGALLFLDIVKEFNDLYDSLGCNFDYSFHVYGPFFSKEEEIKFGNRLIDLNISNIFVEGSIYGDDKFKMLEESSLMVFPTMYEKECFPGVIMEAFSCGMPVISRSIAAVPEIIENGRNGYVHFDDPKDYAQSIMNIFSNDDLYKNMSTSALESYETGMSHYVVHTEIFNALDMVKKSG